MAKKHKKRRAKGSDAVPPPPIPLPPSPVLLPGISVTVEALTPAPDSKKILTAKAYLENYTVKTADQNIYDAGGKPMPITLYLDDADITAKGLHLQAWNSTGDPGFPAFAISISGFTEGGSVVIQLVDPKSAPSKK